MNLKTLEDNAEHLFKLVKHMVQVETNMNGVAHHLTQELHDALEAHLTPAAPVVTPAPIVQPTVVVNTVVEPAVVASAAPVVEDSNPTK